MFSLTCKMGFMNTCLRIVRCSTFHPIKECLNKQFPFKVSGQLSQCRTLMLTQCWRNQDESSPTEKIDLDTWKNVLRNGMPRTGNEQTDSEIQEESSLESMQKLVHVWRLAGKCVPESISTEELKVLEELTSKSSRRKYLKDLSFKENKKISKQKKALEKQELRNEKTMEDTTERSSTYLLKFFTKSEECFDAWRSVQAMTFGQPLVFDMVYDRYMSQKEIENTVSQLLMSEGLNRRSMDPFHIHFCNLQPDGPYHKELVKRYHGAWGKVLITTTEKSHIDIFPSNKLVYLTADSPNVLKKFDHDKIYIVGAFVDKSQKTGVSLGNAKRQQIATARLPLDLFLKWSSGAKNLTLNQMIEILLTLKDTGDWKKALSCVPKRKHLGCVETDVSSKKPLSTNAKTYELLKRKILDHQKGANNNSAHQRPVGKREIH